MNSTHAHFNISAREIGGKLKAHGRVCPAVWIFTVEWSGARSCLVWWRHRFQIASFSPSTLENNVFKKYRFQIAPIWRAFSNGSFFGDRFRRCSVDDSLIRSKTAPFSFENGLVWTGPHSATVITAATPTHAPLVKMGKSFHNYRCNVFTCVFACSLNSDFVFSGFSRLNLISQARHDRRSLLKN